LEGGENELDITLAGGDTDGGWSEK